MIKQQRNPCLSCLIIFHSFEYALSKQKCIDFIKNDHKRSFFCMNTFVFATTYCLAKTIFAFDLSNSIIQRL